MARDLTAAQPVQRQQRVPPPGVAEAITNLVIALVPYWMGTQADEGMELADMEAGRTAVNRLFSNVNMIPRQPSRPPPPRPHVGSPQLPPNPPTSGLFSPNTPSIGESEGVGPSPNGANGTSE